MTKSTKNNEKDQIFSKMVLNEDLQWLFRAYRVVNIAHNVVLDMSWVSKDTVVKVHGGMEP